MPKATVIISTYNQPLWLRKCLCGFAIQSTREFDLLIADDGSDERTAREVERAREETGLTINHEWHEDKGFRKCLILNRAILAARHPYLIFTDGDCIPHRNFVETHLRLACEGHFLSGGYFKLTREISDDLSAEDIESGRCFSLSWLRKRGQPLSTSMLRVWTVSRPGIGRILDRITSTRPTWNGHQASTYKSYLLEVNGFDHRMGYGGEDRELGERLINFGIRPVQMRHRAVCLHLDHDRGYVSKEGIAMNRSLREETRKFRSIRTPDGIKEIK